MSKTVLIVDDEKDLRDMVKAYLEAEGFRVVMAKNGREALFVARQEHPDLILLDVMMPEMGGYDFIRTFNRESTTPIILLTAKVEEYDKVLGLELGADDYITKPFSPRELTARVRAVIRRMDKAQVAQNVLREGDVILDRDGRMVKVRGESVDLTPSEFDILETLMANPGRIFSRLDLLDKLQGTSYEGYARNIDVHVRHLRKKIEADPSEPQYVETVYGMGYRFAREL